MEHPHFDWENQHVYFLDHVQVRNLFTEGYMHTLADCHGCDQRNGPQCLCGKSRGAGDWYTIYHHSPVAKKRLVSSPSIFINQPMGIWDIYAYQAAVDQKELGASSCVLRSTVDPSVVDQS